MNYYANSCFDWLVSEQQSDNPLREAISILSGKYKRFTFVHPAKLDIDHNFFLGEISQNVSYLNILHF